MMNILDQIKLTNMLAKAVISRDNADNSAEKASVLDEIKSLRSRLGLANKTETAQASEQARSNSAVLDWFNADESRTQTQRKKDNSAAFKLLDKLNKGKLTAEQLTDEDKALLAKYSGCGGGLKNQMTGKTGSPYEYYTPKEIASGMWDLLVASGFKGGTVLDPCAGTGVFSATAPQGVLMDSVELDEASGTINKLLFEGDKNNVTISPFEQVAATTDDEIYDAVITNVPFGDNASRGEYKLLDSRYQKDTLDAYFIKRSLDKLKPNGLAVFMSGPTIMTGAKFRKVREQISHKAEFIGAYRLPNKLFHNAGADTITDVLVFKKHNRDNLNLIKELVQSKSELLEQANVLWKPFISGKYYVEYPQNILGTVGKVKSRFGEEVESIDSEFSLAEIAKLMKKLGGSRIDWEMLNGVTLDEAIQYQEGDSLYFGGILKQYKDGDWINAEVGESEEDSLEQIKAELAKYKLPTIAIEDGLSLARLLELINIVKARNLPMSVCPSWVASHIVSLTNKYDLKEEDVRLITAIISFGLIREIKDYGKENLLELFPQNSLLFKSIAIGNKKKPPYLKKDQSAMLDSLKKSVFSKKNNDYLDAWKGISQQDIEVKQEDLMPHQQYERLLYSSNSGTGLNGGVPKEEFVKIYPDVDLATSQEWLISLDGKKVIRAEDYYSGSIEDFDNQHKQAIQATEDEELRAKLQRQWQNAENRLHKVDLQKMDFPINSPFIDKTVKVEWLNRFITKEPTGEKGSFYIDEEGNIKFNKLGKYDNSLSEDEQAVYARFAIFLNKNSFSAGTKDKVSSKVRLAILSDLVNRCNSSFSAYVKNAPTILNKIDKRVNSRENLEFKQVDNGSEIKISGIKPEFKPRQHQAAFVRKQVLKFGGICGFDVGLGKTYSALLAVQQAQSIGVKKKTLFVVPNSTLTNWRKEAKQIYQDDVFERCLFVGLEEKKGKFSYQSKLVEDHLIQIMDNKHDKIFMTNEAFEGISLKTETTQKYLEYVGLYDPNYSEQSGATQDIKRKSREVKTLQGIKSTMRYSQYLEEMKIDSLVIDEAHYYKNAKTGQYGGYVKWLAVSDVSKGAVNALAKTWYLRGLSSKDDGVLLLTATPITNSPMEIYSMLSLAVGEHNITKLTGCYGPNQFLQAFCDTEYRLETTTTGEEADAQVFAGLRSLSLLRKAIDAVADIKTANDLPEMSQFVPNAEEVENEISIPVEQKKKLDQLKNVYKTASLLLDDKTAWRVSNDKRQEVEDYALSTGEPTTLLAHPFNFINKVNALLLDEDLANRQSTYFISEEQAELASKIIDKFNKLKLKEECSNLIGKDSDDVISKSVVDDETNPKIVYVVGVKGILEKNKITLNTADYKIQQRFLELCEKGGLDLDVSLSPKMASLIENINIEKREPKSDGLAKQIIFCDMLGAHNKIKLAIAKKCGISAGKIKIINAVSVDAAGMQEAQDGFNAFGDENKYEIVIANKKAEVGINLQKGCQAIHHLTVGWTPDSLQQRNGRGVRQGNTLSTVNIYQYDVNGTFDTYRRKILDNKSSWIDSLLYSKSEKVKIGNDDSLGAEKLAAMANALGDEEAMKQLDAKFAEADKKQRVADARIKTLHTIDNIEMFNLQRSEIDTFDKFVDLKFKGVRTVIATCKKYNQDARYANDKKRDLLAEKLKKTWKAFVTTSDLVDELGWNKTSFNLNNPWDMNGEINELIKKIVNQDHHYYQEWYKEWQEELAGTEAVLEAEELKLKELALDGEYSIEAIDELRQENAFLVKHLNNTILTLGDFIIDENNDLFVLTQNPRTGGVMLSQVYDDPSKGVLKQPYRGKYDLRMVDRLVSKITEVTNKGDDKLATIYQAMADFDFKNKLIGERGTDYWSHELKEVKNFIDPNNEILINPREFYFNGEDSAGEPNQVITAKTMSEYQNTPLGKSLIAYYKNKGVTYRDGEAYALVSTDFRIHNGLYKEENIIIEYALAHGFRITSDYEDLLKQSSYYETTSGNLGIWGSKQAFLAMDLMRPNNWDAFTGRVARLKDDSDLSADNCEGKLLSCVVDFLVEDEKMFDRAIAERLVGGSHGLSARKSLLLSNKVAVIHSDADDRYFRAFNRLVLDQLKELKRLVTDEDGSNEGGKLAQFSILEGNTYKANKEYNLRRQIVAAAGFDPEECIGFMPALGGINRDDKFFSQFTSTELEQIPEKKWIVKTEAFNVAFTDKSPSFTKRHGLYIKPIIE